MQIEDDCIADYSGPCPAEPCTGAGNDGHPCVIARGEHGPECSYCEQRHGYSDLTSDDEADSLDKITEAFIDAADDIDEIADWPDSTPGSEDELFGALRKSA